jgi:uncharacterized protein YjbI with pentapeptide repeats
MANSRQVALLHQGVTAWNRWRAENRDVTPDLVGAGLRGLDLTDADLSGADFKGADLRGAVLGGAILAGADLAAAANLFKAVVAHADLAGANLLGARFLDCVQLTSARNWRSAYRDEALGCGAPIPRRS